MGTFEYPDFPLDPAAVKLRPAQDHVPGETANAYFKAYARHFGIDGLIRFNTKVLVAEHHDDTNEGGWTLTLETTPAEGEGNAPTTVFARRLIVATGLTTDPILPTFSGQDTFGAPIFHAKDFSEHVDTLGTAKSATVYGVGKFAWDVAYSYATSGVPVHWVIRGEHNPPRSHVPMHLSTGANLTRCSLRSRLGMGYHTSSVAF